MSKIGTSEQTKRAPVAVKNAAARNLASAERLANHYAEAFGVAARHGLRIPGAESVLFASEPEALDDDASIDVGVQADENSPVTALGALDPKNASRTRYWLTRERNLLSRWCRVGAWSMSGVTWNGRRQALRAKLAACRAAALCKANLDRRLVDGFLDEITELSGAVASEGLDSEDVERRFGVATTTLLDCAVELATVRDAIRRERGIMVGQNRSLVAGIARRFAGKGIQVDDLIQEGTLGLLRAIDKFDPTRGFQFSTYAIWWIRQGISRAVLDQGRSVRIPVHLKEQTTRVRNVEARLAHKLGRPPTRTEIAVDAGISEEKLQHLELQLRGDISLQRPVHQDSDGELGDTLEDERAMQAFTAVEYGRLEEHLTVALTKLDPRSQFVVRAHLGLGGQPTLTLDGISQQLGISRERVRQIEREALLRLRRNAEESHLVEYV